VPVAARLGGLNENEPWPKRKTSWPEVIAKQCWPEEQIRAASPCSWLDKLFDWLWRL